MFSGLVGQRRRLAKFLHGALRCRSGQCILVSKRMTASTMKRIVLILLATLSGLAAVRADTLEEKAAMCAGCHGENGIPQEKTTPVIWGQHQGYLYLQLRDYKRGDRKDEVMEPIAQSLERDDMMALAQFFSQKPWPNLQQPRAAADVAAVAQRANVAIGCTGCHQDG